MHTMLMLTSRVEGIAYVNGGFLGEVRPDAPLFRPIGAYGAAYLEYAPLLAGYLPVARRFAMSAGKPVPESFEDARNFSAISWPYGALEIEIAPDPLCADAPQTRTLTGAGRTFRWIRLGARARLEVEIAGHARAFPLPEGAKEPAFAQGDGRLYASGETEKGDHYLLALSSDACEPLLSACGREVRFPGNGRIEVLESVGDLAGRLRRTVWAEGEGGLTPEIVEIIGNPDGDFRALTPEDCALAALEARQLGLPEESEAFFLPGARMDEACARLAETTTGAVRLRFAPPDGQTAVGALRVRSGALAEAVPVYYSAEMTKGAWRLSSLRAEAKRV